MHAWWWYSMIALPVHWKPRVTYANRSITMTLYVMSAMASQITSLTIVYSTVYSCRHAGTDERKHQSSASLAFVRGIHRWPVNFPLKGPVTRKMFPFDDVIMRLPVPPIAQRTKLVGIMIIQCISYPPCVEFADLTTSPFVGNEFDALMIHSQFKQYVKQRMASEMI